VCLSTFDKSICVLFCDSGLNVIGLIVASESLTSNSASLASTACGIIETIYFCLYVPLPSQLGTSFSATVILSVPNPYHVTTNIPWENNGPVIGGTVQIPYYQTIQYVTGQGTLGIDFNGSHFFKVGDIITIDKSDKSTNIEYDGTASVVGITTYSVAINKEWNGTASSPDGGLISRVQRISGTSSIAFGYNGTRQYDESTRDFGLSYSINSSTITANGATAAGFLTNYDGWKEVPDGYTETAQAFITNSSGLVRYKIKTYNENMTFITGAEIVFAPTYTRTYTFGVGPEDVKDIFGSTILNGATYYEVFLDTASDS